MSILSNRVKKLESTLLVDDEVTLHKVIWVGADNDTEPTHYLVNGKLYANDDTLMDALKRDYPNGDMPRVLWEPHYVKEAN